MELLNAYRRPSQVEHSGLLLQVVPANGLRPLKCYVFVISTLEVNGTAIGFGFEPAGRDRTNDLYVFVVRLLTLV